MARSFVKASHTGNVQFVVATHSPYFLDPTQLEQTFRVESSPKGSIIHRPLFDRDLSKKLENGDLDKYFLESITESLFSQAALVVEGDTERAIFDTMPCDSSGLTLRDLGISVAVAGGAKSLLDMAKIIRSFGVPTLVVRDGDSDPNIAMSTAKKKCKNEIMQIFSCEPDYENRDHLEIAQKKQQQLLDSWRSGVESFVKTASEVGFGRGLEDFKWGKGLQIGKSVIILNHDLESELHQWRSFVEKSKQYTLADDFRNSKKAGVLARVAVGSDFADMPDPLKEVMSAIRSHTSSTPTMPTFSQN